jgi:ankyrin repeat protein
MSPVFPLHDPVIPSREDVQSFCEAANRGDTEAVRDFLDQFGKSIVNERDNINARALTWAAFSGQIETVRLLVERGADINAGGTNDKPALTWAIESGRREVAEFLLKKGASLDARDDAGSTPVDYAKRAGNGDMLALIDARLLELKEYERLHGEKAKEEAAKSVTAKNLEMLKKKQPPKLGGMKP